ncbi:glycoside hydrolase family 16 protein [Babjeviella inositovora NRRL Y-12698]|uniref:Crh-like protein n=1 Tax=Babjeviella inositovora NRRL Y-12698 TaxID=984486 RepID=A0A1E3QSS7_9ASCO|nr:glycoside hydrolase family 16 protein [Babjeviella inositovora NRRL Y-12698]ODQ80749.1 glycoside hydrolase family 16 protein [Babjeviella inositovora NRRL Y-12698]
MFLKLAITLSTLCFISFAAADLDCNPLNTTVTCSADPALGKSMYEPFSSNSSYFSKSSSMNGGEVTFSEEEGVKLSLVKRYDNPALESDFYIMFGRVEAQIKVANGTGVVSSFYLQSDDLDEIDLEWFGQDIYQTQTNFFSKGNTTTYDRGVYYNMPSPPQYEFYTYTIDWTSERLEWYVDGVLVRTLSNDSNQGYPQSPMKLLFGIWAGGDPSNAEGTILWAGGETDYADAPFSMYVKNLVVTDYSTGSSYSYSDTSGSWESIVAAGGAVNGRLTTGEDDFDSLVAENIGSTYVIGFVPATTSTSTSSSSSDSTSPSSSTQTSTEISSAMTSSSTSASSSSASASSSSASTSSSASHSVAASGAQRIVMLIISLFQVL